MDWSRPSVNAVIDTNVIAYFLLGTDRFVDEARDFMTALGEAWAPAVWEAELANVLWMATRHNAGRWPGRSRGSEPHPLARSTG